MNIATLEYINGLEKLVTKYSALEKEINEQYFENRSFEELKRENHEMYKELLGEAYENSFANPAYTGNIFGDELGKLLSAIYSDYRNLIAFAFHHETHKIELYNALFVEIKEAYETNKFNYEEIKNIYVGFNKKNREIVVNSAYENNYTKYAKTHQIISDIDLSNDKYLFQYGQYISKNELKLAEFMRIYPKDKLKDLAITIANAYVEGFKQDNKDMTIRHKVRTIYNIGQELMVKEIFQKFEEINLEGIYAMANTTEPNKQYSFDHKFDNGIYLDEDFVNIENLALDKIDEKVKVELKDCSGIFYIEKFGETPFVPQNKKELIKLTEEQTKFATELRMNRRNFAEKHMPDKETSFCIVAFPSPEIGENFEEIYEDTCKINSMKSEIYEPIHKIIIDTLDQGEFVQVKGQDGNETNILVRLPELQSPDKQTNFFNCTADVNIPVGEVFTSPQLEETNGLLHLKKVYLNDLEFIDLRLNFIEGYVKDYSCGNFGTYEENRKYIEENLLFPHKTLPLGEFAIGTNTLAYVIAKKHNIVDKLPILIVEKMGPHFAIGDTCYSWAEDLPVYNNDGKEIVARDNSHSLVRKEDKSKAYTNVHTDITIPYDELDFIKVIIKDKKEIEIIRNGRFVLEGTEYLNKAFEGND